MNPLFRCAAALLLTPLLLNAGDLQARVGDVQDRRTTGQFFGGLELELKLTGDSLADAKSIRPLVKSASDDTGRNLLEEDKEANFSDLNSRGGAATIKLKLRNPARKATSVKELKGELEVFTPRNDPDANIPVKDLASQSGKKIDHPMLKAAQVEVMVLTKSDFDARKAKAAEQKKNAAKENGLADAFEQAFSGLFSGFMTVSENSVVLLVRDPGQKLVNVEFGQSNGAKARSRGRSSSKQKEEETRIYDFEARPDTMTLQLMTPKSVFSLPLAFTDIPLP